MKYNDFGDTFYRLVLKETILDLGFYHQFVNWVRGEFDLFLQDNSSGLKIYVPNVFFCIDLEFKPNLAINLIVFNKSKFDNEKLFEILVNVLNHLKQIQSSNQI